MIDLDHSKRVNDRYGHQTGDDVLCRCARVLEENVRATDFLARYGGECCAMLPNAVPRGECRGAEKLREAVKALPEPVPTISVGVGNWEPGISAEEPVHRADQALYRAKETGRDRVEAFGRRQGGDQ